MISARCDFTMETFIIIINESNFQSLWAFVLFLLCCFNHIEWLQTLNFFQYQSLTESNEGGSVILICTINNMSSAKWKSLSTSYSLVSVQWTGNEYVYTVTCLRFLIRCFEMWILNLNTENWTFSVEKYASMNDILFSFLYLHSCKGISSLQSLSRVESLKYVWNYMGCRRMHEDYFPDKHNRCTLKMACVLFETLSD